MHKSPTILSLWTFRQRATLAFSARLLILPGQFRFNGSCVDWMDRGFCSIHTGLNLQVRNRVDGWLMRMCQSRSDANMPVWLCRLFLFFAFLNRWCLLCCPDAVWKLDCGLGVTSHCTLCYERRYLPDDIASLYGPFCTPTTYFAAQFGERQGQDRRQERAYYLYSCQNSFEPRMSLLTWSQGDCSIQLLQCNHTWEPTTTSHTHLFPPISQPLLP